MYSLTRPHDGNSEVLVKAFALTAPDQPAALVDLPDPEPGEGGRAGMCDCLERLRQENRSGRFNRGIRVWPPAAVESPRDQGATLKVTTVPGSPAPWLNGLMGPHAVVHMPTRWSATGVNPDAVETVRPSAKVGPASPAPTTRAQDTVRSSLTSFLRICSS